MSSDGAKLAKVFFQCLETYEARSKEYGSSWRGRTGMMGVFAKIESKTDRLYEQVWKTRGNPPLNACDSAIDNIVFNGLMAILIEEHASA